MATTRFKLLSDKEVDDLAALSKKQIIAFIKERFGRRRTGRPVKGIDPAELNRERVRRSRQKGKRDE